MKPTEISPRQLVFRGAIEASAVWFDLSLAGEVETRRRVLEMWHSGARVWEIAGGVLLVFAAPKTIRAQFAPGTILVEREGYLLGCPLNEKEWRALGFERTAIAVNGENGGFRWLLALPRDGALFLTREAKEIEVSDWLDASTWQTIEVAPLGEALAPVLAVSEVVFEARRALDVPASPELERFLAAMRGETISEKTAENWRDKWKALWRRGERENEVLETKKGEILHRKRGAWWERWFQFNFGAGGVTRELEADSYFSSELGLLAQPALILAGIALLVALFSGGDATGSLVAVLGVLAVVVAMSWGFLLLARLLPTPTHIERGPQKSGGAWGDFLPFDLISLFLVCGAISILAHAGAWVWVVFGLVLAFYLACEAHWKRRRVQDGWASTSGGFLASLQSLFGGKKSGGAGGAKPKPPRSFGLNALLWRTELARLFGARQARYMMRMMQMFERGDLENALRHAVPFNTFENGPNNPALGLPHARQNLDFLGARGASGSGVPLPPHIKEALAQHYRAAFETLRSQNRVDEAAFVLAELLDSPVEAVEWLEQNGSYLKAAQLAQTRNLEAGLAVRLWWLAGERERAIVLARRLGAFSEAIARLERGDASQKEAARMLRVLWAQNLASGGDFAGAVEAAWPVVGFAPDLRGVVGVWIERGLENEGPMRAKMLARQAHLLDDLSPAARENWRDGVRDLLDETGMEGVASRLAFAGVLSGAQSGDWTRAAARRAVRALSRDAFSFPQWSAALKNEIEILLRYAGDASLRADWNPKGFPAATPRLATVTELFFLEIDAFDVGNGPIWDAILLPDGRALWALGENGARLQNRDGKVVARFDFACHRLVLGENDKVLGVALRGLEFQARFEGREEELREFYKEMGRDEWIRRTGFARFCRFDLARKTAQNWGELPKLSAFGNEIRGGQWMVAGDDSLLSLDAVASGPTAIWRGGDVGEISQLSQNSHSLALLTNFYTAGTRYSPQRTTRTEVWRYDFPSLVLRERRIVTKEIIERYETPFLSPDGWTFWMPQSATQKEDDSSAVVKNWSAKTCVINATNLEKPLQIEQKGVFMAALSADGADLNLRLWAFHQNPPSLRWHLVLRGASRAHFRLGNETLSIVDARGRFVAIDLTTGAVLRNDRLF